VSIASAWFRFVTAFLLFTSPAFGQGNDSLKAILNAATDPEKLIILTQAAQNLSNNSPYEALDYATQAIDLAHALGDESALARNYQLSGRIHYSNGNFAKAKEAHAQALSWYGRTGNEKGKAESQVALASIYFSQGNLPAAAERYLSALSYYERTANKTGMVMVLSKLGDIYKRQNNFSKAIEYHRRAMRIYEESSDKYRMLVISDQIGNIYLQQNNFRKADEFFRKSLRLYKELNNQAGVAFTLHSLGNTALQAGQPEKALTYFAQSMVIARKQRTQPLVVGNLNGLAQASVATGKNEDAIRLYQEAVKIAREVGLKMELEKAYTGLAEVYKLTRQTSKQSTFRSLSSNIRDSLYNDSIIKKMSNLELMYIAQKKQSQIELLSREQKIRESELLRERQRSSFFTIASVILGIIFIVLVLFFIQNKRIARRLQRQKNELQIKNTEIIAQSEQLRQLNTVKDRFFSIISHDLRNNLTSMRLYFDLISNPEYDATGNTELTKQIAGSVENTIDLLENLLVWASAQIKGVPMHIQKINMHSLAEENIHLLAGQALQKRISLHNSIPEDLTAYGDIDTIRLILRNLISNATKFTPEDGRIEVLGEAHGNMCRITVKDNGVGISKRSMELLFRQHENPTTKGTGNEKGTGLGLILCKDFIERNSGRIWAESEEGKGSSFIFELPLSMA
jgi:signal transduction histidine kinase